MTKLKNTTAKQKSRTSFEKIILELLEGMGEVKISKGHNTSYLIKNNIIFAKIVDNQLFLKEKADDEYIAAREEVLKDKDLLLIQATKSYFCAKKVQDEINAA